MIQVNCEDTIFCSILKVSFNSFLLSKNSIEAKKDERYEDTIKSYHKFVGSYPSSDYRDEVESYFKLAKDFLVKKEELNKNKG